MGSAWRRSFKPALVLTVVFALCALWIQASLGGGPMGPEETRLAREVVAVAVLSGFLTSLVVWWTIVARAPEPGVGRGLLAGIAAGVLIHPVCWSLAMAGNSVLILFGKSARQPLGELPLTLTHEVVGVFALTIWSLLFFGSMTVVAGALAGGVIRSLTRAT
jgi:hypothetical protein